MKLYYLNISPLRYKDIYQSKIFEIDEDRRARVERIKSTDDKLRCIGAGLLIQFIKREYNVKERLVVDKFGKPYFENSKVKFNISHSGCFVIAAVSESEIGVDVQRIEKSQNRIAEKNFLKSECDYINEVEDENVRKQRFYEIWTVKEAYLKQKGIGLRKPLNSFQVEINEGNPMVVNEPNLRFVQIKMNDRYIIAICTDVSDKDFDVMEVSFT